MEIIVLFLLGYYGFIYCWPILQLWTLLRCKGWWRVAAILFLLPALPLYLLIIQSFLVPISQTKSGQLIVFVAPVGLLAMLYLPTIALGYELSRRRKARIQNPVASV
jgi:hypothetical protein